MAKSPCDCNKMVTAASFCGGKDNKHDQALVNDRCVYSRDAAAKAQLVPRCQSRRFLGVIPLPQSLFSCETKHPICDQDLEAVTLNDVTQHCVVPQCPAGQIRNADGVCVTRTPEEIAEAARHMREAEQAERRASVLADAMADSGAKGSVLGGATTAVSFDVGANALAGAMAGRGALPGAVAEGEDLLAGEADALEAAAAEADALAAAAAEADALEADAAEADAAAAEADAAAAAEETRRQKEAAKPCERGFFKRDGQCVEATKCKYGTLVEAQGSSDAQCLHVTEFGASGCGDRKPITERLACVRAVGQMQKALQCDKRTEVQTCSVTKDEKTCNKTFQTNHENSPFGKGMACEWTGSACEAGLGICLRISPEEMRKMADTPSQSAVKDWLGEPASVVSCAIDHHTGKMRFLTETNADLMPVCR